MQNKNCKFLLIWENNPNIIETINRDKSKLQKYYDIIKRCENKTRIIIWYTGNDVDVGEYNKSLKYNFPAFLGNKVCIEQYKIMQKLSKNHMNIVIFDCYNESIIKQKDFC